MIPVSMIDLFVEDNTPLEPAHFSEPDDIEKAIGIHCANLIEDGATLRWESELSPTQCSPNSVIIKTWDSYGDVCGRSTPSGGKGCDQWSE